MGDASDYYSDDYEDWWEDVPQLRQYVVSDLNLGKDVAKRRNQE